jgi:hypothetical protein
MAAEQTRPALGDGDSEHEPILPVPERMLAMERTPRIRWLDWPTSGGRNEKGAEILRDRLFAIAAIATLLVCALLIAGCGGDDETTTTTTSTSPGASAQANIDTAVQSCSDQAQQLGGAAGTALASACTSVGNEAKQAVSTGGEQAQQALTQAASSCESAVGQLPAGQAQNALSSLCDAIKSAG